VLVLQGFQLFLGSVLGLADPAQQHFDQLVAALCASLLDQAQKESMALARPADIKEIAHFHATGLGSKLTALGMGDLLKKRIGIEHTGQPSKPFRPELGRFRAGRARGMLEAIEAGRHSTGFNDQQTIQQGNVFITQTLRGPGVDRRMDFRAQVIGQPIERAERRQIDRRLAQNLDRQIDQVGRIAHRRRRFRDRTRQQMFAPLVIGHDIEKGTDCRSIPVERLFAGVFNHTYRRIDKTQLRCQMGNRFAVEISRRRKETEILARLQQNRQRQTAGSTACLAPDKNEIGFAQTISMLQLLPSEALP
jgi:hypothetical protein